MSNSDYCVIILKPSSYQYEICMKLESYIANKNILIEKQFDRILNNDVLHGIYPQFLKESHSDISFEYQVFEFMKSGIVKIYYITCVYACKMMNAFKIEIRNEYHVKSTDIDNLIHTSDSTEDSHREIYYLLNY